MAFTRALYYPSIEITNESWLKTAILYWDEIDTIVPESVHQPYQLPATEYLADEGVLKPLFVNPEMDVIKNLNNEVEEYLACHEEVLFRGEEFERIYTDKMSSSTRDFFLLNREKLSYELQHLLENSHPEDNWIYVNGRFAHYYLTLLANRLCEAKGIAPLTDSRNASELTIAAQLGNDPLGEVSGNQSRIRNGARHLAEGTLFDLAFRGIKISDDNSFHDILSFKRRHQDELGLFRTHLENLAGGIPDDASYEQMQQFVKDVYENQFLPGFNDLKRSLSGAGIKWIADNLMKVSFFSTGATSIPTALLGFPIPSALLAGAVVTIVSSLISYNVEKKEFLRHNPYSYYLAVNSGI